MLKLTTDYGLHELFLNSNMTSIMGYIHYVNNTVIKLQIRKPSFIKVEIDRLLSLGFLFEKKIICKESKITFSYFYALRCIDLSDNTHVRINIYLVYYHCINYIAH
jgi:hypothetical protein